MFERGAPTYVFEVQVGGSLVEALGQLKHAYDLWNSGLFLVARREDMEKIYRHLEGTFHEIKGEAEGSYARGCLGSCRGGRRSFGVWRGGPGDVVDFSPIPLGGHVLSSRRTGAA